MTSSFRDENFKGDKCQSFYTCEVIGAGGGGGKGGEGGDTISPRPQKTKTKLNFASVCQAVLAYSRDTREKSPVQIVLRITMRSAKTTARLTQRNIFKNNISAGQTSLLQV